MQSSLSMYLINRFNLLPRVYIVSASHVSHHSLWEGQYNNRRPPAQTRSWSKYTGRGEYHLFLHLLFRNELIIPMWPWYRQHGHTALICVGKLGNTAAAKVLLNHGADPNIQQNVSNNTLNTFAFFFFFSYFHIYNLSCIGFTLSRVDEQRYILPLRETMLLLWSCFSVTVPILINRVL